MYSPTVHSVSTKGRQLRGATVAYGDWATVPWCQTNFADYTNKSLNHLNAEHTPANNIKGIGDICRYMGVVDGVTWHTPTAADFAELYGSDQRDGNPNGIKRLGAFANGSYTPLSGAAFGPGRNNVTLSGNNRVTNADPNTDGAVFLPANGFRYAGDKGAVYYVGSSCYSWSSTAYTPDYGHYLAFTSANIYPQTSHFRSYATYRESERTIAAFLWYNGG